MYTNNSTKCVMDLFKAEYDIKLLIIYDSYS